MVTLITLVYRLLISMGAEIAHFAESFQSFHYSSQKVNTYFTGLPNGPTYPIFWDSHQPVTHELSSDQGSE